MQLKLLIIFEIMKIVTISKENFSVDMIVNMGPYTCYIQNAMNIVLVRCPKSGSITFRNVLVNKTNDFFFKLVELKHFNSVSMFYLTLFISHRGNTSHVVNRNSLINV